MSGYRIAKRFEPEIYIQGVLAGDRVMLSRAITLIESSLPSDRILASKVIEGLIPHSGKSIRIGITGVPGVGKSTFIESFGSMLCNQGNKLAVLAIDPSSKRTGGSILGDKTRMVSLSNHPNAYIRPTAAGAALGGVAIHTRESILLCEAAGFNVIFVETVGVGQSETLVHGMVDFFLLLMLAGAGDELQGIKKGIMEMADAVVINKADGDNAKAAQRAKVDYQNALHLFPPASGGWIPKVMTCSALQHTGLTEIWDLIQSFSEITRSNGYFFTKRKEQNVHWMHETIQYLLQSDFFGNSRVKESYETKKHLVEQGLISPTMAAYDLLKLYSED